MKNLINNQRYFIFFAWLTHLLTASGAVIGLFALYSIHQQKFILTFWLLAATIAIDGVDGTLARIFRVKETVPQIDGTLLDNLVDFLNFVILPAYFLLLSDLLQPNWRELMASLVILGSAYQFSQIDAKTEDHFFKGFPSYWSIAIFYLFIWQLHPVVNFIILFILFLTIFLPIKYVYPSRMDYVFKNKISKYLMLLATIIWSIVTLLLLIQYPQSNPLLNAIALAYFILYLGVSLYRTIHPLPIKKDA